MKKRIRKKSGGAFFVLDGPDGSGKTTQAALLEKRLKKEGYTVTMVDFPQYSASFFGVMVAAYLRGEFGDVFTISPYLSSMLYALDRWSAREKMQRALANGHIILANRYTSSNIIHQGAKIKNKKDREEYFAWLEALEFAQLRIPRPTRVIFLDVPTKISWKLIENRNRGSYATGSKRDKHEASKTHLSQAYTNAKAYAASHKHWSIVPCTKNSKLLTPEAIHGTVYKTVKRYMK